MSASGSPSTGFSAQPQKRRPGRAQVSCAECRRLKLRCDRKVPCETCVKRGCAALCPTGTMQTGKSNRTMAIVNAEEMQAKIDLLTSRVHQLEDTLRQTSLAVSESDGSSASAMPQLFATPGDSEEVFVNAYGTLALGSMGDARYFGNTARSEFLVHAPSRSDQPGPSTYPRIGQDIIDASLSFDLGIPEVTEEDFRRKLFDFRPSLEEATRLCDIYLEYGQYIWNGIPREELFREVLAPAYALQCGTNHVNSAHGLSLLFIVLALATLFDMDRTPWSIEAEEYYLLSRAALRLASPTDHTTLWSIHSLLQMCHYLELSGQEFSHRRSNQAWLHMGLAIRLSHSIGLHVNNAHWKLDQRTSQRRSHLFWQIFVKDTWMSFNTGRPPTMSLSYIDCELVEEPVEEYHPWMFRYSRLLHKTMKTVFGTVKPTYQVILQLDRKLRDFPPTPKMKTACGEIEETPPTMDVHINRWLGMSSKEAILVRLHRPYFAQALSDQPGDLLRHRFSPSVVSIYRSAWRLIEGFLFTFKNAPHTMERVSLYWSHPLTAAIVMCLIITRAPSSNLAGPALRELDKLHAGMEDASTTFTVAENNLLLVKKLCSQSHEVINKLQPQTFTLMELDRLGGQTQLIVTESLARPAPAVQTPFQTLPDFQPTPALFENMAALWNVENLHPTIMDDWKTFEGFTADSTIPPPNFSDEPSQILPTSNDIQMIYSSDLSSVTSWSRSGDVYGQQDGLGNGATGNFGPAGPLMLDPTWQNFVEQLGF